jgi:hypothetical protein
MSEKSFISGDAIGVGGGSANIHEDECGIKPKEVI